MSANEAMIELLSEVLAPLGAFKARAMFGGHGLYLEGTFFALLDDGVLYFKVSPQTQPFYEAAGSGPFTYETKTGTHALASYWRVPDRVLDEPDTLMGLAVEAVRAARAVKPKGARAKPRQAAPAAKAGKTRKTKANPRAKGTRIKTPDR